MKTKTIRSYRENYKNWKNLVNRTIPIGIIYGDLPKGAEWTEVRLIEDSTGYLFEFSILDDIKWHIIGLEFPTTKDWNELVNSFKNGC